MTTEDQLITFIQSLNLDLYHQNLLRHMLSGGKYFRKKIFEQFDINNKYINIGWAIEILHSCLIIYDDIIDNSDTRRGKKTWHILHPNNALKDAMFLYSLIFRLLNEYKHLKNFNTLISTFTKSATMTWFGQCMDSIQKEINTKGDLYKYYNHKFYLDQVIGKTGYYTFYLPIMSGCIISNKEFKPYYLDLCYDGALFFQFKDDYLNFFPEKSGKSENDLQEKKVTWFLCELMKDKENINIIFDYYKNNNYTEIRQKIQYLLDNFNIYESDLYQLICEKMEDDDVEFKYIFNVLNGREK